MSTYSDAPWLGDDGTPRLPKRWPWLVLAVVVVRRAAAIQPPVSASGASSWASATLAASPQSCTVTVRNSAGSATRSTTTN